MHRQSLGSPTSKLRLHGGEESSVSDDDDSKEIKPRRSSFSPPTSALTSNHKHEKLIIHLIPVLTLVCFLVLYLNSHSPSQSDLAQFNGFKHSSKQLDSTEISHDDDLIDSRRADALGIRSLKNLQELDKNVSKSRPHRKIADF